VFEPVARWAEPANIGQVAFYMTAAERTLRTDGDDPRIGIMLVADEDVIEYTRAGTTAPMAVARDAWADPPGEVRRGLPAAEDLDCAVHHAVRAVAAPAEGDLEPA